MTFLQDSMIVFRRAMRLSLRNPVWVFIGLTQPILYLVLFAPLLQPLAGSLGTTNSLQLFVPGLLIQLGIFGALFVGFGLIAEWRDGVIEAMRVTPASRTALLMGRVLRDIFVLLVQGLVLLGVAYLMGMRADGWGLTIGLALVVGLGAAFSCISYAVALTLKSEDAMAPLLNGLSIPILLLSGILLPMSLAPQWLQNVSDIIPVKHIVTGVRAVFRGDIASADTAWGIGWAVVLLLVGLWFGARTFRKQNA